MATDPDHPFWKSVRGDIPLPPCARTPGIQVMEAEPDSGKLRARFEARPEFANPLVSCLESSHLTTENGRMIAKATATERLITIGHEDME